MFMKFELELNERDTYLLKGAIHDAWVRDAGTLKTMEITCCDEDPMTRAFLRNQLMTRKEGFEEILSQLGYNVEELNKAL